MNQNLSTQLTIALYSVKYSAVVLALYTSVHVTYMCM